jgi:ABC-type lipoprotein export system ATPase subunit
VPARRRAAAGQLRRTAGEWRVPETDGRPPRLRSGRAPSGTHALQSTDIARQRWRVTRRRWRPRIPGVAMALFSRSPSQPVPASTDFEPLPAEALVSLRNVEKSYAHGTTRTWVLRRITLDIKDGEFVSIMGPSGAGKSTLLHIVGMHDSAWTGDFYFGGQPVHRLSPKDRARLHKQHIGFVFQSYHLLDHLTVYENLDVPLSYRDIRKAERDSMVCDILDRFQIVGKKDLYPNQLSGGQQQLVAVARAVIANPKVILADEPTGNLHSSQGREIMELFKRLNDTGTTIVQVTHSETNASYGSRVIELKDGWVVS